MSARRRLLGGILASALALVAATSASAALTIDPGFSVLYVKGDAGDDRIIIECAGGVVAVNGTPAAESRVPCRDISRLGVTGFGGDDVITVGGFGSLTPGTDLGFGGSQGSIEVTGGDGNDTLISDADDGLMIGGAGDDHVSGRLAFGATLVGGPGDDRIVPGPFFNFIFAGRGGDVMQGAPGITFVYSGPGSDSFAGHGGTELVLGGRGADHIAGGGGRDVLLGSDGSDRLFGGKSRDLIAGGPGRDEVHGGPGGDVEFQDAAPSRVVDRFVNKLFEGSGSLAVLSSARRFLSQVR